MTLSEKKIHGSTIAVVAYCNIAPIYILLPSKIAFKRIYNVLLRHPPLQLSEMQLDDNAKKKPQATKTTENNRILINVNSLFVLW